MESIILEGDAIEAMKSLDDGCIDTILTDPPYGTTSNKWDVVIPLEPMWDQIHRILKPNGVVVLTCSQPFTSILVTSNILWFRHEWIWIKNRGSNFANTVREPMKEHESVIVFSPGKWTYNKQMQERTGSGSDRVKYNVAYRTKSQNYRDFSDREENQLSDLRVPSSWQKINTVSGKEKVKHPTQKPIELMEYFVKTYSNPGDMVLDFSMGSGTTGIACKNLERNFIGIDNDPDYIEMARERIGGNQIYMKI